MPRASINCLPLRGGKNQGGMILNATQAPAAALPASAAAMTAFWNLASYSGTGDVPNSGAGGAGLVMTPNVNAPTWNGALRALVFDGINDSMKAVANVAYDAGAAASPFSYGVIVKHTSPFNVPFPVFMRHGSGTLWHLYAGSSAYTARVQFVGTPSPTEVTYSGAKFATGLKTVLAGVANGTNITAYANGTAGTSTADTRGAASYGAGEDVIFANSGSNYAAFELYGAFIHQGAVSPATLVEIAQYYNITP